MKILVKYTPVFLLLVFFSFFLAFKNPGHSWDRSIASDGKGYYAYLPACFIYHDLTYGFVEHYEELYYPKDHSQFKEFRIPTPSGVVNKYFPGLAILWLPFFLLAHFLSLLFGFPADGYSVLYQYAISCAALFYLWLGLHFLAKLLRKLGATPGTAAFITVITALGTNIIFFTIVEDSMTHVYSFSVTTVFLYATVRFFETHDSRRIITCSLLFALICIIRPVNGLIILMVPALYFLVHGPKQKILAIQDILRNTLIGFLAALPVLLVPVILWFLQTGHPFVYSYGQESFDFSNPWFFSILFSYNRGWFLYTPVAFISMGGFISLYRNNRKAFIVMTVFFILFIYITSCWWMWYYTSKFGQRVFIDLYAVTAILLFFLIRSAMKRKKAARLLYSMLIALSGLNLFQCWQHSLFIFPATYITKEIYRDSFFSLYPKARVYLPDNSIKSIMTLSTDMEHPSGWINEYTITGDKAYSGKFSSCINRSHPYSIGLTHDFSNVMQTTGRIIRISAMILTTRSRTASSLVIDFSRNGKSFSYNPFYLHAVARPDRWTKIEAAIRIPDELQQDGSVTIFFYNPTDTSLYVDDMKIDFLTLYDKPEFRYIEGVLLPCR